MENTDVNRAVITNDGPRYSSSYLPRIIDSDIDNEITDDEPEIVEREASVDEIWEISRLKGYSLISSMTAIRTMDKYVSLFSGQYSIPLALCSLSLSVKVNEDYGKYYISQASKEWRNIDLLGMEWRIADKLGYSLVNDSFERLISHLEVSVVRSGRIFGPMFREIFRSISLKCNSPDPRAIFIGLVLIMKKRKLFPMASPTIADRKRKFLKLITSITKRASSDEKTVIEKYIQMARNK